MRKLLLAVSFLVLGGLVGGLSGCVWPPDSTPTGYNNNNYNYYYTGFYVHRISERSISGKESLVTLVSPNFTRYNYNNFYYPDSVQYIIVNGDTAYRRAKYVLPATYDSSAPYRIDGTANFVTIVYPSFTVSDTTFEGNLTAQITAPPYGDTIPRSADAMFSYQATNSNGYGYPSGTFEVSDSVYFYPNSLQYGNSGTIDVSSSELELFHPGTLWADLFVTNSSTNDGYEQSNAPPYYQFSLSHQVDLDRIVAYPLQ